MKLYYHKTDGGAEYLTDKFILCGNGRTEGVFENANYIVRIDGDINKDAELSVSPVITAAPDLLEALKNAYFLMQKSGAFIDGCPASRDIEAAIAKAEQK